MNYHPDNIVSSSSSLSFGPVNSSNLTQKSSQPRKILYPLKALDSQATEQGDDSLWIGLTPLDMVAKIVSLAAKSTAFDTLSDSNDRFQLGRTLLQQSFLNPSAGQKRKRDNNIIDGDGIDSNVASDRLQALAESGDMLAVDSTLKSWRPSSIAGESTEVVRLDDLVQTFELMAVDPSNASCIPSYNRIKHAFLSNATYGDAVSVATSQMQALIEMVSSPSSVKALKVINAAALQPPGAKASTTKSDTFQFWCDLWLKKNWGNPFPDQTMLEHLGNHLIRENCITLNKNDSTKLLAGMKNSADYHKLMVDVAIEKITNWLGNTRSLCSKLM